jgi:hypothetical protein
MKTFKTIGPPKNIVSVSAHIDLTMEQWHECRMQYRYDAIVKAEVKRQLGWDGPYKGQSAFHYLLNNQGVRLTIHYEYEELA